MKNSIKIIFIFSAFLTSDVWALSNLDCQNALLEFFTMCEKSPTLAKIETIKNKCFANPIQGNNGGKGLTCGNENNSLSFIKFFGSYEDIKISNNKDDQSGAILNWNIQNTTSQQDEYYEFYNDPNYCNIESIDIYNQNNKKLTFTFPNSSNTYSSSTKLHKLDKFYGEVFNSLSDALTCNGLVNIINATDYNNNVISPNTGKDKITIIKGNGKPIYLNTNNSFVITNAPVNLFETPEQKEAFLLTNNSVTFNTTHIFELGINSLSIIFNYKNEKNLFIKNYAQNSSISDVTEESSSKFYRISKINDNKHCSSLTLQVLECSNANTCSELSSSITLNVGGTTKIISNGKFSLNTKDASKITISANNNILFCDNNSNQTAECSFNVSPCNININNVKNWINETNNQAIITYDSADESVPYPLILDNDLDIINIIATIQNTSDRPININNTTIQNATEQNIELTANIIKENGLIKIIPRYKLNNIVYPNELLLKSITLNTTINSVEENSTIFINGNNSLLAVPLAICMNIEKITDQIYDIDSDNNSYKLIETYKPYKLSQYYVGCSDNCPTTSQISQEQLKQFCENSLSEKVNLAIYKDNVTKNIDKSAKSLSTNCLNSWVNNVESNCSLVVKNTTISESINEYNTNTNTNDFTVPPTLFKICTNDECSNSENTLTLGLIKKDRILQIQNTGWYSFSNESPLNIFSNNKPDDKKTFFYSPIYTVLPNSIKVTDYSLNDFSYSYNELESTLYKGLLHLLKNKQAVGDEFCPAYFNQYQLLSGYINGFESSNQINHKTSNFIYEYFYIHPEFELKPMYVNTINTTIPNSIIKDSSLSKLGINNYIYNSDENYSSGLSFSTLLKINSTPSEPKQVALGYNASVDACIVNNTTFNIECNYPIKSLKNDIYAESNANLGLVNTFTYNKGRIVSDSFYGENDIYVPLIIMHLNKDNEKGLYWKQSKDSCSTIYLRSTYDKSIASNIRFYKKLTADNSNILDISSIVDNKIKMNDNSISTIRICQNKNDLCFIDKAVFNQGILFIKATRPENIDNYESYSLFEVITNYENPLQTPYYPLNHLVESTTSNGGFIFREYKGNKRIISIGEELPIEQFKP
ncbi:MAG: hypothetical protein ACI4V7_02090 [Succinivibrionaceae bacterium]